MPKRLGVCGSVALPRLFTTLAVAALKGRWGSVLSWGDALGAAGIVRCEQCDMSTHVNHSVGEWTYRQHCGLKHWVLDESVERSDTGFA